MAGANRRYTMEEILHYLDDEFDIPDEGMNSDVEGLDEEDSDILEDLPAAVPDDDGAEEINLRTVDIDESSDDLPEANKSVGRPNNVTMEGFDWSSEGSDLEVPPFSKEVGSTRVMPEEASAVDFFSLFVDNRILNNMVRETNRYAVQTLESKEKDPSTWKAVTLVELKGFLGLVIAMSMHRLTSLRDYWSSDWVLAVPAFAKIMARNRFLEIWSNLHLSDNSNMPIPGHEKYDKLFKVRQFLEDLKTNFKLNYHPHREQAVDEAMIKYKGRTSLKQYMPMKPIKRGIKMWCRADSTNGYLCDFDIYTGKSQQGVQHGLGYSVVTKLCASIKGHWYAIFCDNFFTSYKLVEDLYVQYKILCCGTLRTGRKEFPRCLFDKVVLKRMQRGDIVWRMKGPVLAVSWIDKKPVFAAGTNTSAPPQQLPQINRKQKDGSIKKVPCPPIIVAYNKYMGGVDKNDQMKSYYTIPVSGKKWWTRILFDLLDRAIFNSFILEQESPNHTSRPLKEFRISLAKELIGDFSSRRKRGRPSTEPMVARQVERHFLEYVPTNDKGKRMERRCKVCSDGGKFKRTSYFCPECDVGLCAAPCFGIYHQS